MSSNSLNLTREWYAKQQELTKLKKEEADLRKATIEANFGENLSKGTQRSELSESTQLVLAVSETISIDKDAFLKHKPYLESLGLIGEDKLIVPKYSVSASAYKHLDESVKVALADLFVFKQGSPQLKVEVNKG